MEYDYIVIGSGSSGSIVATRLSENPNNSVLLIEGGPDYPNFDDIPNDIKFGYATGTHLAIYDAHNWGHTGKVGDYADTGNREIRLPRGKVTGGTSSINGQIFLRGLTHDFKLWKNKGIEHWKYEDVLPYFTKLETDLDFDGDFHGSEGPIVARRFPQSEWSDPQKQFYNACISAGYPVTSDLNLPDATGVGPFPCNNYQGIRMSTSLGYLSMARHRVNLTIKANCYVNKLFISKYQVKGAEIESSGEIFQVYGDKIILCGGVIANPQILMLSGVGPAHHLENLGIPVKLNLPGIGQNLSDHPMNYVKAAVKDISQLDTSKPMLQVGLRYSSSLTQMPDDMIMYMNSYAAEGDYRDILFDIEKNHNSKLTGIQIAVSLYLATSKGYVVLNSNDPKDKPLITLNLLKTDLDVQRMAEGIKIATSIAESPDLANIVSTIQSPSNEMVNNESNLHSWLRQTSMTGNHMTSTCAMGISSDPMAVVNDKCNVFGLDNLFIADASIMPDCVRANTNVTTMMVGERVSNFLIENS